MIAPSAPLFTAISLSLYSPFKPDTFLARNVSGLKGLYKLRDIAVKSGADGAIILKFKDKLYAIESEHEQDYKELERYFDFKNGDVLIIAFSNEKRHAENGALAIVTELNNSLKK